ncbi:oxidoreductase [Purpureocillium lavendulum]|uniref:Oxidoreductase n=1 Tax=Purpureocillium lavendulum TaxID=1247861 RepID=A0AB34FUR6_9HYPO|nr:oxidoreductase [Purpureocillium lavendulum]
MKFTAALLALAATAAAAPTEVEPRTGGGDCNNGGSQVCCSGLLNCLVQAVGDSCSNQAYCCQTDAPVVSRCRLVPSTTVIKR